jgi:hypothetical protein
LDDFAIQPNSSTWKESIEGINQSAQSLLVPPQIARVVTQSGGANGAGLTRLAMQL